MPVEEAIMFRASEMLSTHPRQPELDAAVLARCIEECFACAQACTSCADACLGESNVQELVKCIRLNEDCKTACLATGEMLSRQTEADWGVLRAQLEACRQACATCAAECEKHAGHMEHCRVCADACRSCERACEELLSAIAA